MVWRGAVETVDASPAPSGVVVTYDSASVAEARAVIAHGIERRVPLLTLTGKLGAGTSEVLHSLYERFAEQCDLALPAEPPASITDLSVPVLRLLARPFIDAPSPQLLASIQEALEARAASPRPLALLLDDAESLPDEVLEALAAFGPPEGSERARLPIVLAGRPGLLARLSARKLAPLRRGLTIDVRLHTPTPVVYPDRPAGPTEAHPPRRAARPRTVVLASLVACLSGATVLYLESVSATGSWPPPASPRLQLAGARPSALAALIVPRPAPSPDGPPAAPAGGGSSVDAARQLVLTFQRAVADGDGESLRTLLAPDVRYNGMVGIDAALDDQIWLGRGGEQPRFLPPDAAREDEGGVRVESPFHVPYRDVAGVRGEVTGRAVWHVIRRAGQSRIVRVEYDIIPAPLAAGG